MTCQDGVPRYGICTGTQLRKLCDENECVREGVGLYLKPNPVSPWHYVNSSEGAPDLGIAKQKNNLDPEHPSMQTEISGAEDILRDVGMTKFVDIVPPQNRCCGRNGDFDRVSY